MPRDRFAADVNGQEFLIDPRYDQDGVQASSAIGRDGKEYPDPVPLAPPVGYNRPPDLMEMLRHMLASERFREEVRREDFETFEEADDFDVLDDPLDPRTPYEAVFDPPPKAQGVAPEVVAPPPAGMAAAPVASTTCASPVPEKSGEAQGGNGDKKVAAGPASGV